MNGAELISVERERQEFEEGWTPEHDDRHTEHELALAAACYAAPDKIYIGFANTGGVQLEDAWPFEAEWDKRDKEVRAFYPGPLGILLSYPPGVRSEDIRERRIRELAKAGALLAAEIDRLQRAARVSVEA